MRFARAVLPAVAVLALAMPVAVAQEVGTNNGRSVRTLARIALKSRGGAPILLGSRVARDKPTLIAIWASWCLPCYGEAVYLNRIRRDLGGRFNFIYVNRRLDDPDPEQPPETITRFLATGGMTDVDFVVADVPAYRRILGTDVGTIPGGKIGIPRIYLFDRNGRQIYAAYGFLEADGPDLVARVKQAAAK